MDKLGITVVAICALLFGVWFYEDVKLTRESAEAAQREAFLHPATNSAAAASAPTAPETSAKPTVTSIPAFETNQPEHTLVLTNGKARYTFTSRGGGLKQIELIGFPQTASVRWKQTPEMEKALVTLNQNGPAPVLGIVGDPALVGDGNFTLTKTANGVQAEKMLPSGLRILKEFDLGSNYLVYATVRLENRTGQPMKVPSQNWVVGAATPMDADDNGLTEGAMWYDGNEVQDCPPSWFAGAGFGCFRGSPRPQYLQGSNNVEWAAVHNQFFTLMAMPPTNQPAYQILAEPVALPWLAAQASGTAPNSQTPPTGVETALVYPAVTIAANAGVQRSLVLYAGPKEYKWLARIGEELQNHADLVMNWGSGYISFFGIGTFFAKALLLGMNGIHALTGIGYGLTIVIITILLRLLFWPLTAASTRSAKRMQALAPEIKALQEKYKDDPQKIMTKQWELYKKHNCNPMGGCLPMLVQTPVFMGFFTMIRSAIELRGAHFLWAADLSKPDTLAMIPGLDMPFNLLPLLMVAMLVWQAHLQPASPGMDPSQQKMMRYMPLMLLVILYNYSSGMALYMTVNTLVGVIQNKLTRVNTPAAAATVNVDARLTPASKKQK